MQASSPRNQVHVWRLGLQICIANALAVAAEPCMTLARCEAIEKLHKHMRHSSINAIRTNG